MAREPKRIDITRRPELVQLVEQPSEIDEPHLVIRSENPDTTVGRALNRATRRSADADILARNDALFKLVGNGKSNAPAGASGKKRKRFLDTYRRPHK